MHQGLLYACGVGPTERGLRSPARVHVTLFLPFSPVKKNRFADAGPGLMGRAQRVVPVGDGACHSMRPAARPTDPPRRRP